MLFVYLHYLNYSRHEANLLVYHRSVLKLAVCKYNYNFGNMFWCIFINFFKVNFLNCFYGNTSFIERKIASGKNWAGTRAFMAQADWNDVGADVKYFKLDDLKDGMDPISDYLGIYLPDMPMKNVSEEKTADLYSETVASAVSYIYDIDFQILGYKINGRTH